MKRSILKKAGTVLLTTATGFCWLSSGMSFGQDAASSGSDIQRRMAQMYAREGKSIPGQYVAPKPNPRTQPPRQTTHAIAPTHLPTVPSGITAPVNGSLPVVTAARPAEAKLPTFPKMERLPNTDPAPPVPAITPGPTAHPLASTTTTGQNPFAHPKASHPLAESEAAPSSALEPDSPHQHPLAATSALPHSTFEMPVSVEPAEENLPEPGETVMTPPIAPNEAYNELEAEWDKQVELELTPTTHQKPAASVPMAPPAVSASENPFEQFPTEAEFVAETGSVAKEASAPAAPSFPGITITPAGSHSATTATPAAESLPVKKTSSSHVGLGGFCPVTLRDNRIEVPGRAEHQCEWQGVIYNLASAQAKARFESHPEQYAPAHGGFDVTLISHQGHEIPGTLEHAVWYRRHLYLFRDAASLKTFTANPAKFAK